MWKKGVLGASVGAASGFGYHLLMRAMETNCINCREPLVPVLVGLIGGIFVAANSVSGKPA